MGRCKNITHEKFPQQTENAGRKVMVCFHHDTNHTMGGTIVRDDAEEPFRTIIQLDNGNFVLGTECMFTFDVPAGKAVEVK